MNSGSLKTAEEVEFAVKANDGMTCNTYHNPREAHEFQLMDDPLVAEKPGAATLLSIFFLGLGLVAPISCGFIVVTGVLVNIGQDLNNTVDLGWIVSGWAIASSVSFSLGGSLSDIFGRRNVILVGDVIALAGAITGAVAQDLTIVIAGSTLLGFSCGLILVAYAAIPELLPNQYRGLGLAWIEAAITLPWGTFGVLLGNLFVLRANWRWIYYVSTIYAGICLIGTAVFYFPPARPLQDYDRTRWQQFLELDFGAILLYTVGLTSVMLGLSWAGTPGHSWNSVSVIAPIVLGVCGFIASFIYDFTLVKRLTRPLFPKGLMRRYRQFTVSLVVVFVAGMVYYSMSGLLPQGTLYVFTNDPLEIGYILLPNGFGQAFATAVVPLFIHYTKKPKCYIIVSLVIQTLSNALYAYGISFHRSAWMAFQFFGQGCFGLITVVTVLNSGLFVLSSELGVVVGLLGTFRSMGGSVGSSIFNTILRLRATAELDTRIALAATTNGFTGNMSELFVAVTNAAVGAPNAFENIGGVTASIEQATLLAYRESYAAAYRIVFYSTIPFGVVAIIAAFFIADASEHMTKRTEVRLEKDVLSSNVNKIESQQMRKDEVHVQT